MQRNHVYSDKRLVIARTASPGTLTIYGAIDQINAADVARALGAELQIASDGSAEPCKARAVTQLCLDLSRLEFLDTCGIRALVKVAEGAQDGGRLVLMGLPPLIRKVMLAIGWGDLPGLVIVGGDHKLLGHRDPPRFGQIDQVRTVNASDATGGGTDQHA